jgi:hypothetical protein
MNYNVKTIPVFEKQAKKLIKKYSSLKTEVFDLIQQLKNTPNLGTSLGNNCFKIRIAIASKNKGKRGGARIITCFVSNKGTAYLLTIYDKTAKDDITDAELIDLLSYIPSDDE